MQIKTYTRKEVVPLLPMMNEWCSRQLGSFPYLYAPRAEQMVNPTDTIYVNEEEAMVVVMKEAEEMAGIATGISLSSYYLLNDYFSPDLLNKFSEKGFDPAQIWYMGYFLMSPRFRHHQEGIALAFDKFKDFAKLLGKTQICYIDVVREADHPLRPEHYLHPEPWGDILSGFSYTGIQIEANWPTVQEDGSVKDDVHSLQFHIKDLT